MVQKIVRTVLASPNSNFIRVIFCLSEEKKKNQLSQNMYAGATIGWNYGVQRPGQSGGTTGWNVSGLCTFQLGWEGGGGQVLVLISYEPNKLQAKWVGPCKQSRRRLLTII